MKNIRCPHNDYEAAPGDRLQVFTLEELESRDRAMDTHCPEYRQWQRNAEEAFRRGYHYAVSDVIDFLEDHHKLGFKKLVQALVEYHNGPAWKWHYKPKDLDCEEWPPKIRP